MPASSCTRPKRARSAGGAPLQGAHSRRARASARVIQRDVRVPLRLGSHVVNSPLQVADSQRAQIVSVGPPQFRTRHDPVAVRNPSTRALESLHESWDIGARRKLQNYVDVVPNDAQLNHSRPVTGSDRRQHATQKRCGLQVNQR